jgi:hypothetical protein
LGSLDCPLHKNGRKQRGSDRTDVRIGLLGSKYWDAVSLRTRGFDLVESEEGEERRMFQLSVSHQI